MPSVTPDPKNIPESTSYANVISTFQLRDIHLKNRLFFAPMGLDLANRDGTFSDEMQEFYDGIAEGGCGLIVLSNATVSPDSILQPNGLRLYEPFHAESLRAMIASARECDVEVGIQLQHYGGQGVTTYTKGKELLTPSGVASELLKRKDSRYRVREMTQEDIDLVKGQFVHSALLAEWAGARLIQLQASNGYLLSSFLSPHTNQRKDVYGGNAISRARLLIELVAEIREKLKPSTLLSIRLGVDDCLETGGSVPEDFKDVIPLLEQAGIDLIEVSVCIAETFSKLTNVTDDMRELIKKHAKTIKGFSRVPVGFAGLVRSLEEAEQIVANGEADFVGMARALFADNDLIRKTLEGRRDEINWCLWDGKCFKDKHNPRFQRVYCCVNPKYRRPE